MSFIVREDFNVAPPIDAEQVYRGGDHSMIIKKWYLL